jgi:hypothetical protein
MRCYSHLPNNGSRMRREPHVRFCESRGGEIPPRDSPHLPSRVANGSGSKSPCIVAEFVAAQVVVFAACSFYSFSIRVA